MTDAVFTDQQGAQFDALASTAWALLDAERQGNRALAASAVPIFCASWNAWGSTVRMAYHDAPASLSLAGGGWSHAHDDALKTTMAVYVQTAHGLTAAQVDHLLGLLDSMPSGMPFQAFRGVWFDTSFLAALPGGTPGTFDYVDHQFAAAGAATLSMLTDQISQGIDPSPAPMVPSLVPNIPAQTEHPSSADAAAFVMPRPGGGVEFHVTGDPGARLTPFQTAALVGGVTITAAALAYGAYYVSKHAHA